MNIVILGAGKIGAYTAKILSLEEHDVTLIDQNIDILEQLGRDFEVATIHAKAPSWRVFEELAENQPDVLFAATGDDETNLAACTIAKNLGFKKTIARIKAQDYLNHEKLDFFRLFFVDHFVAAEALAAQDLFNTLIHAGDIAAEQFAHGAIQMRTVVIPDKWDRGSTQIKDLQLPENLIIGLIRRRGTNEEKIIFPHGEDQLLPGDEVALVGEAQIMNQIHNMFHITQPALKTAVLFGGTLIAEHLASFLIKQKVGVRIVEYDYQRCGVLAERLPQATIINRDGRDPELLKNERIKDADVAVCCTYHDGTNMLIAAIAKQFGCPKTIALIANSAFTPILDKIDVLPALSAQVNLTNRILSILHEDTILGVGSLCNDEAKIVELKVAASSKCVGIPLSDLHLPQDLLIAVIQSQGKVMIGKGNRVLSPDDTVIVICSQKRIPQLTELFHK